jgi:membrane protease YdiL (CAAX protease family)
MTPGIDRKRILIFVGITYGITLAAALGIFLDRGRGSALAGISSLMMASAGALGNIATRLITREGWSNMLLRPKLRRGWPFYMAAWVLPLVAILMGGAIYFLLFPGRFDPSMAMARESGRVSATDSLATVMGGVFLGGLVQVLWLMFIIWGEEFGWRAYLLPKLMPLGGRKAVLLVGAIWGVFHWPMIFMGFQYGLDYWGAPIVGPLLFVLIILSPSVVYSWMTLRTGSVWPACLAHAVHNTFCNLMILFLRGEPDVLIGPVPEGIVGCLGYILVALPILLIPGALAASVLASRNVGSVENTSGQATLGATS